MGRGARIGFGLLVSLLAAAPAGAEKKKPGLFDFGTAKLPYQYQQDAAKDMSPGRVDLTPAVPVNGEPRVLRIRIYSDTDYRGLVLRWQTKARAQIARINAVVQPVFNVRFEIESFKEWNESHVSAAMPAVLERLEALDPATDVDLVLALTTPLQGVAASIHAIGQARLLARHFLMRGMDDEKEALAIEGDLHMLDAEQRRKLYSDRKGHKEVVIFLHEWGHTLGLLHNEEATNIMNPRYDPRQSAFSDYAKKVIALVVERRVANRSQAFPETAALVPLLEGAPSDEGGDAERANLLAFARQRASGGGRPGKPGGGGGDVELSAADIDAFNRAVGELNAQKPVAAWTQLAPVIERASKRKDVGSKTWLRLAGLAAAAGALTVAEDAIARAGGVAEAQTVVIDVASARQHVCLQADAKLTVQPGNEPAYVAAYGDLARGLGSLQPPAARERLRAFEEQYAGAPGTELLACELEVRTGRPPAAVKRCEAAVARCKQSARAHYLLGLSSANAGKQAAAEASLEKAITIEPADEGPWSLLARLYRRSPRSKQRLVELEARHAALLSTPLPKD